MKQKLRNNISIFFIMIFMVMIAAPTVIMTVDDSVDISCFFGINEEEENENLKLVFENYLEFSEVLFTMSKKNNHTGYTFKTYPKPHLNLIFPPPEFIF